MSDQYEFNEQQNQVFQTLASSMKFVGIALIILGPLTMLNVLNDDYSSVISGVINMIIGFLTLGASKPVQQIVDTEGNDIDHLMNAATELGKLYGLQKAIFMVGIVFIVIAVVLGVVGAAAS